MHGFNPCVLLDLVDKPRATIARGFFISEKILYDQLLKNPPFIFQQENLNE